MFELARDAAQWLKDDQTLRQGTQAGSPSKAGGLRVDGVPEASTARSGPASSRPSEADMGAPAEDLQARGATGGEHLDPGSAFPSEYHPRPFNDTATPQDINLQVV